MLDFISKRFEKTLSKMKAKTILSEEDIKEVLREIKIILLEADVNLQVVKQFINDVSEEAKNKEIVGKLNPHEQVIKIVQEEIVKILKDEKDFDSINFKHKLNIFMMVGLQGSGKTTTTAKIVSFLRKKDKIKKPLMIAADIYRLAAVEQLRILGQKEKIDVFYKENETAEKIVEQGLEFAKENNYDFVIIDTAGRLAIDEKLMQELINIKRIANPHEILFVNDAYSGQDIINVAQVFNEKLKLSGFVITKLDSDARVGASLSLRKIINVPILFMGSGEKIKDLEIFYPERVAKRILGMGDILSFVETAQENIDENSSERLMKRMILGKFDLNDLVEQLKQIKKMGKMSKVLKMLPGLSNKISEEKIEAAEKKLALFEILISSMTNKEKSNPKILKNPSRKTRIIKGSGRSAKDYNLLINEFERMSKQMKETARSIQKGTFNPRNFGNKF